MDRIYHKMPEPAPLNDRHKDDGLPGVDVPAQPASREEYTKTQMLTDLALARREIAALRSRLSQPASESAEELARASIFREINAERERQDTKWGEQNHPVREPLQPIAMARQLADEARGQCEMSAKIGRCSWERILMEEVYEVFAEDTPEGQRAELVQVAAVAVSMIECIDRKRAAILGEGQA